MIRRRRTFAATSFVSILALTTAAFGAPGAAPMAENRNAAGQAVAVTADGHRPPAEIDGGDRRDEAVEVRVRAANVRVGPALDSPRITTVTRGCLLPVLERSDDWVRVGLDGDRAGWIHGPLVAPPAAGPEPTADRLGPLTGGQGKDTREVVEVRVPHANVRGGPTTTAAVITARQGGCLLPVLERTDGWVRVGLDGDRGAGWMHGALVAPVGAREARAEAPVLRQEAGPASASALEISAPLRPEPPRPSMIEPAPAPSQKRSGARLVAPVTMADGLREPPNRPTPAAGRPGRGGEVAEVEYVAGSFEAAAGFSAGMPSRVQRSRAQPATPATTVARAMAMTAPPAAAPPPGQTPDGGGGVVMPRAGEAMPDDKLQRFRTTVEHVNLRVRRAVGMDVFAEIEHLGGGTVALTATKAWLAAPEAARRANLQTLSRRWGAVHEPHAPIAVRIVNDRGEVMMEERRSGAPVALSSVDG